MILSLPGIDERQQMRHPLKTVARYALVELVDATGKVAESATFEVRGVEVKKGASARR